MKKNKAPIHYNYIVRNISEDETPAYEAFIPAFNTICFGDTLEELEEGIRIAIRTDISDRRKAGKSIPSPDRNTRYSGKTVVRLGGALHECLALSAQVRNQSLNQFIKEKLESCVL
ncbi:MAG: hypothetical protein G01um101418_840 [Parcubacteria group bacterium Gr01-1014_18]|nr:MAG: hypothetical protein Greene041636_780 [Parcubacteria group bacterium Greene0416_36]TSC80037.1 MAG: hypothetical protein G01um101418_840 [Parcubacteria group bacterium Gr01-1014_18]TSC98095.1 MAG: hypothetical protein Greene101420_866 [Parcubacteria group bacterium Greene1014_20]TSD06611.1 MAG: hypothetical protein Greene07142_750 [Parcubacteria group bacterium Greene0714_2]